MLARHARLLPLLLLTASLSSCIPFDQILGSVDTAVKRTHLILDEALASLNNNSADWQRVLQDTANKLTDATQSTVRNEVNNLLQRSVSAVGVEAKCGADFLISRVREGLLAIKAKVLNQPVPPVEPHFCNAVPLAVDRALVPTRLNLLEFYGYNFDTTPITVLLQEGTQQRDITHLLNRPTHYHLTLALSGTTGVPLTANSQRLILKWSGREISTVGIIQPVTPPCRVQTTSFQPNAITLLPPHTRGDRDYKGHGPKSTASVTLQNSGTVVRAITTLSAVETREDWTTAQGQRTDDVYVPPSNWRVSRLLVGSAGGCGTATQPATCFSYTDSNHTPDIFPVGSGPASRFEFVGDTEGNEAGTRTNVTVTFNPIRVELVERGNCIPPSTLRALSEQDLLSPEVKERVLPMLKEAETE